MAMTQEHKEALKKGRAEARAIKSYLSALGARKPGRPVTMDGVRQRLQGVSSKIEDEADSLKRLELIQKRLDLEQELKRLQDSEDFDQLEVEFKRHAASYSDRKGISYTAWREAGVPASVLKDAGIAETRRR